MTLNPNSRLVRFAYSLFNDGDKPGTRYGPKQTSLCAFFWRAFVFVPFAWLTICGGAVFFVVSVLVFWKITLSALLGASLYFGVRYLYEVLIQPKVRARRKANPRTEPSTVEVFVAGVRTIKAKMCPIIDFKGDAANDNGW